MWEQGTDAGLVNWIVHQVLFPSILLGDGDVGRQVDGAELGALWDLETKRKVVAEIQHCCGGEYESEASE